MLDLKPTVANKHNPLNIQVGDTVRIRPYLNKNMHGESHPGCLSGQVGVVMRLRKDYHWRSGETDASIRYFYNDGTCASETSRPLNELDIESKGTGEVILGVTHPFSPRELYDQRLKAFDAKIKATVVKWDGWSNAATYQAFLALNTDQDARRRIDAIRRKDGSVNTNKLRDIFNQFGFEVADWALEPIIDIPEEFEHEIHRHGWRQRIDWDEIAAEIKVGAGEMIAA